MSESLKPSSAFAAGEKDAESRKKAAVIMPSFLLGYTVQQTASSLFQETSEAIPVSVYRPILCSERRDTFSAAHPIAQEINNE